MHLKMMPKANFIIKYQISNHLPSMEALSSVCTAEICMIILCLSASVMPVASFSLASRCLMSLALRRRHSVRSWESSWSLGIK